MIESTAAETHAWIEEHGLTDAVRRAAAQLPPVLPAKAVELLRDMRRDAAEKRTIEWTSQLCADVAIVERWIVEHLNAVLESRR